VIAEIRLAREIQIVFFVLFIPLSFIKKNVLCVARTLKDRVHVPLGGYQADFEACFGIDVTAGGKIYRTYNKKLKKTDTCSCGALV